MSLESLYLPIKDFIQMKKLKYDPTKTVVSPTSSLREVIDKLSEMKFHRIFVLKDSHPFGVITLGDVLRVLTASIKVSRKFCNSDEIVSHRY